MIYRVYVTDSLKMLIEIDSRYMSGANMLERYYDLIFPKKEETRTAEEIIEHIRSGLRGEK